MSNRPVRCFALGLALLGALVSGLPSQGFAADGPSRIALVLSNAAYPDSDDALPTPISDGKTLAEALQRRGFAVQTEANANEAAAAGAVKRFLATVKPGSIALVFLSGLGIEVAGRNYLVPVDARLWSEADVLRAGLSVDQLIHDIGARGATAEAVVLDASRRNPFERRFRSVPAGLAPMAASPGTLSLSAAAPGALVEDAPGATTGIFTTELVKALDTPGLDAEQVFSQCRDAVAARTRDQQAPSLVSGLDVPFSFETDRAAAAAAQPEAARPPASRTSPEAPLPPAPVAKLEPIAPPAAKPAPAAPQPVAAPPAPAAEASPTPSVTPAPPPAPPPAAPKPAAAPPARTAEASPPPTPVPTGGTSAASPPAVAKPIAAPPSRVADAPPVAPVPSAPPPAPAPAAPPQQVASLPPADAVAPSSSDLAQPQTETPLSAAETARQAELNRRINRDSRDQDAFFERGRLLAQHGSYSLALLDLDRAISLNPSDADALNDRCWTRTMVNQLQTALEDCDQALKLRPNFADAHDSRGLAMMKRGTVEAALADYDAAIALDPKQSSALYGRGIAKLRLGRRQEAERDISSALAIDPDIESEYARYGLK